jgi:uncharacterized membrane protein YphA (DoxX/SURF4 family)
MADLAQAAALVLAVVFAWAAVAKVRALDATTTSFRGLGLPAPGPLARVVPAVEAALAVALVWRPGLAGFAALALVVAFSLVIVRAVASGSTVGCACFGGQAERPVSVLELVRNAGLGALAIVATGATAGTALWPSLPALVIVSVLVALSRVGFAAADLRRDGGHVFSTPLPGDGIGLGRRG